MQELIAFLNRRAYDEGASYQTFWQEGIANHMTYLEYMKSFRQAIVLSMSLISFTVIYINSGLLLAAFLYSFLFSMFTLCFISMGSQSKESELAHHALFCNGNMNWTAWLVARFNKKFRKIHNTNKSFRETLKKMVAQADFAVQFNDLINQLKNEYAHIEEQETQLIVFREAFKSHLNAHENREELFLFEIKEFFQALEHLEKCEKEKELVMGETSRYRQAL